MYDKSKLDSYLKLFNIISDIGYERSESVYIVGGFVRDLFLERPNKDLDFVVLGDALSFAEEVAKELKVEQVRLFPIFGTAHFNSDDMILEFSMGRRESYALDSRKPFVFEATSLYDDIIRRDFTINSMAISLNRTTFLDLVDLFEGELALEEGKLITPTDPMVTFDDDPLRIMRMCRFCSQLPVTPSPSLISAAISLASRMEIVSKERITNEFLKIMKSKAPAIGLDLMYNIGILPKELMALGEVVPMSKDIWKHTLSVVQRVSHSTSDEWVRIAALFHDVGKPLVREGDGTTWTYHGHEKVGAELMDKIFEDMKLPLYPLKRIKTIIAYHGNLKALAKETVTDAAIRRILVKTEPFFEDLWILFSHDYTSKNNSKILEIETNIRRLRERIDALIKEEHLDKFILAVSGQDIMKAFSLPEGPPIGVLKRSAEKGVLDGLVNNNKEEILEWLKLKHT